MAEQDLFLSFMLQHVTDYKMVAVGNDTNGTILYQKVGAGSIPPHTHTFERKSACFCVYLSQLSIPE